MKPMKSRDLVWWALRSLSTSKVRAALLVLGIAVGAASIVALLGLVSGARQSVLESFMRINPTVVVVRPNRVAFTEADYEVLRSIPHVKAVVPIYVCSVKAYGTGAPQDVVVLGIPPSDLLVVLPKLKVAEGSMYTDMIGTACVGWSIAHPPGQPYSFARPGSKLTLQTLVPGSGIRRITVTVMGVFEQQGTAAFGILDVDHMIMCSPKTISALLGMQPTCRAVFIVVDSTENVDNVVGCIKRIYGKSVDVVPLKAILDTVNAVLARLQALFLAVGVIALGVAGIGVAVSMIMTVRERTREIGVLKAVGYTSHQVLLLFLSEAAMIGVMGGAIGALLGSLGAYALHTMLSMVAPQAEFWAPPTPQIRPEFVLLAFATAVVVSIVSGAYPSYKASRLDPVIALRYE